MAKEIFDLVRDDLAKVEQEFAAQSALALRAGRGNRQLPAGRRRQAPAAGAAAACGGICELSGHGAVRLGAVVELIHSATLIHDDVIDGAQLRRGRPSSNARWGNHMSVLAGDWLYMQAFQMALDRAQFPRAGSC